MKGDVRQVDLIMVSPTIVMAQHRFLRNNLEMRMLSLGGIVTKLFTIPMESALVNQPSRQAPKKGY